MKKAIINLLLITITLPAYCDVIFSPYPFTGFCYSAEFIYSYEKIKTAKNTTNYWGGIGCVGWFFYHEKPLWGLEVAVEKRHYFQSDKFKNFFISAYLGSAYMTDFKDFSSIGLVPGFKINFKAQISSKLILEPYISLSLPITYELRKSSEIIPFPALTIGARFGLFKFRKSHKSIT